ncbi:MAG TPA: hypothetical protein DHV42_04960, partial [Lachnospiraceae bacterium]|nr:hypothetical protein [Lachnospiraceae bacterium]
MSDEQKKKSLVRRGVDCLFQLGLKHTLYVIATGEYRKDEDDVFTVAESRTWEGLTDRKDVVMSSSVHSIYDGWIQENETYRYASLTRNPMFSVVVPVYNVEDSLLSACIESVRDQSYPNWELILVDDCSSWESVRTTLRRYEEDRRIKVIYRKENGNISRATNDGLAAAKGDFIAFADCDDVLAPNALYEMAVVLNEHPEYDFIYSDEDKLSEDGTLRHDPFFKPDWSPDTFFSMMYTNHLAVYRAELVKKTGGLRPEFDGAQDYDFTLRFLELTDNSRVGHIPKVLYYWRERKESAATGAEAKPYALIANERAKAEALLRRGISAKTEFVEKMNQYRVVYDCIGTPLVSIVIPSKDNVQILTQCIRSIRRHTDYPNYEIILVDNGSSSENREKITRLTEKYGVRYHYEKMEFNFSRMCNIGAGLARGEYILLLNDDIEVTQDDWLSRMTGQAMQAHTGAVGAKLLYPDSTRIQHDGVVNRRNGPAHILQGQYDRNIYYYGRNLLDYNCFAVTGACLMVSAEHYRQVGGMDEELHVTYNDVDLCLNLSALGLYHVVRNDVVLYHHESVSRGLDGKSDEKLGRLLSEQRHMWEKHPEYKNGNDPFYSRHFGEEACDFTMHKWNMADRVVIVSDGPIHAGESGTLAYLYKGSRMKYRFDEVRFEENYSFFYGFMYLKTKLPVPVYLERYLLLTAEDGGQILVKLNRQIRLDIHVKREIKDPSVGFLVRVPDHLLDRGRTSYRVSLLLKSAGNAYAMCVDTDVVIPRKEEEYCTGVHLNPRSMAVLGHGMVLTEYDRDEDGVLRVSGYYEGGRKDVNLRNSYLVVREKEGLIYYHLWDDDESAGEHSGSLAGAAGGRAAETTADTFGGRTAETAADMDGGRAACADADRSGDPSADTVDHVCDFRGRIRSRGEVQAILCVERLRNTQSLYPITYELLCRQLGGATAYWNRITQKELERQRERHFEARRLFSILVPLYNTPEKFLGEMIDSVRAQTYGNWELCLADGSDEAHASVGAYCRKAAQADRRILYRRLEKNGGISENTNECMKMASGGWLALFDHDDTLAPNALYEAMRALEMRPDAELIYTDEDKVDEEGVNYTDPHFKPDYDPELLRTNNYICHFLMVKRELADRVGGLRSDYNGAQDFDFVLRCTEKTQKIVHIPRVLYHWRMHAQSTAASQESKLYAYDAARKAIEDHLTRCGVAGAKVEQTDHLGYYRVIYPVRKQAGVSILIRVKDQGQMLEKCIASICEKTTYPKYEILIADTGSKKGSMSAAYRHIRERYADKHPIHIYPDADLEKKARGTYLVELDPGCEIQTEDWLERMLGNLQRTQMQFDASGQA